MRVRNTFAENCGGCQLVVGWWVGEARGIEMLGVWEREMGVRGRRSRGLGGSR